MRVGLAYDLKQAVKINSDAPDDALEEYDSPATVEYIKKALENVGHSVIRLGGGVDFIHNVLREKIDIVFNISEGQGNYRSRESQVPAVLEMLNIPYTGSDPECLAICLDKPLTKKLIKMIDVHTPQWIVVNNVKELDELSLIGFPFPAILKPVYEGSSKGVHSKSLVNTKEQAVTTIKELLQVYEQPVMIEQFIDGDEITVGILGNASRTSILGMMRISPRVKRVQFIYSVEVKRDWQNLVDYEAPANLPDDVRKKIIEYSYKSYELLGCRDFARIDFRVSKDGIPYMLEINPLPGLGDYSDLIIMALKLGWRHEDVIVAVLNAARERYPLWVHA